MGGSGFGNDLGIAEALAAGAAPAQGGKQEGVQRDGQKGAELLVTPAVFGFGEQPLHGCGDGAVAREMYLAQKEQADAVGIEAAVVVVASQVEDLAQVAEGGGTGGMQGSMDSSRVTGDPGASTGTSKSGERPSIPIEGWGELRSKS